MHNKSKKLHETVLGLRHNIGAKQMTHAWLQWLSQQDGWIKNTTVLTVSAKAYYKGTTNGEKWMLERGVNI